jgi:hypothetical protein
MMTKNTGVKMESLRGKGILTQVEEILKSKLLKQLNQLQAKAKNRIDVLTPEEKNGRKT